MKAETAHIKSMDVKKGESFVIHLWEDRTRGEQWVPTYDPSAFALLDDEFLRTTSNNAVDSGQRTFEFLALEPGQHQIEFQKRMAWKYTAEDRRVFSITISDHSD